MMHFYGLFLSDMEVKGLTMTQFLAEETIIMTHYAQCLSVQTSKTADIRCFLVAVREPSSKYTTDSIRPLTVLTFIHV